MEDKSVFSLQIAFLKSSAVWPLQTKNVILHTLHNIYTIFTCTLLSVVSVSLVANIFFSRDLKNISSTVDIATLTISAMYKLIFTKVHLQRFKNMVSRSNIKFKKFISNKNGDIVNIEEENKFSNLYSILLIGSGIVAAIFWSVLPAFEAVEYEPIYNSTELKPRKNYPLQCWIPFDTTGSPLYEIVYALEGFTFLLSAHIYLTGDAFFFMMIYQICLQLKMIAMMIANIETDRTDFTNKCITFQNDYKEKYNSKRGNLTTKMENGKNLKTFQIDQNIYQHKLKECIDFHRDILWFVAEIEDLYRSMILADVLHAIISLSFALFETGTTESITGMMKMYMFLLICIVHQFLNSHYGQMLINAQEFVLKAAYESQWYNSDIECRKYLLMILTRSNRFTILNGGKMYHLRRESFVLFSKTLFSYYMVLRQVTTPEE